MPAVARTSGPYRLEVASGSHGGSYRLTVEARRKADPRDLLDAEAAAAFARAEADRRARRHTEALAGYEQARERWQSLGDLEKAGDAHSRQGRVYSRMREWDLAIEAFGKALAQYKRAGDENTVRSSVSSPRASTLNLLGHAHDGAGQPERAIVAYRKALALSRAGRRRPASGLLAQQPRGHSPAAWSSTGSPRRL